MGILEATQGQQNEGRSFAGPSSYPTGGFSARSDLGRVDEATVQVDNGSYDAHVESVADNNALIVQVVEEDTASEVGGGTDLSGETFVQTAYRL